MIQKLDHIALIVSSEKIFSFMSNLALKKQKDLREVMTQLCL